MDIINNWQQVGAAGAIFAALMWVVKYVFGFFVAHLEASAKRHATTSQAFVDCLTVLNKESSDRHKETLSMQRENVKAINLLTGAVDRLTYIEPREGGRRLYDNKEG